ncbi:hypothetical protein [Phorcysia thermohydrogeniphila]|uniref:Uncharacterized protein n=1 Tax=Phorcysia thermohydrogeniphila TaxID=936138 RepID=A0A4R1G8I5_9BACT|nr:hypothetical protein [Phorcysia thermohydrogeniphila]TCK02893.1 hypothetical protein CLV27_1607 [Phorcysia thermohydrogeniphila]
MAKSFNDGLAKGLGLGATIVGFMMMSMFSLLPLGIFSSVLDLKHYMGLKLSLAALFALLTFSFYVKYVKNLKLPPIVWGFGTMISLIMSGVLFFVTVDVVLKILGLE